MRACGLRAEDPADERSVSDNDARTPALADWLSTHQCEMIALEATGEYWKPVWHVLSDLLGVSGRAIPCGLIEGETSPDRLPAHTTGLLALVPSSFRRRSREQVREHHRFLLRLHLTQIEAVEEGLRNGDGRLEILLRPCFSPSWASDTTKRTSLSPRFTRPRRNASQNARSSDAPTSTPRIWRYPSP